MPTKKQYQKKACVVIASVMGAMVLILLVLAVILRYFEERPPSVPGNIQFADPSLSADIYADAAYMALDRSIHYVTNDGYTITVEIPESEYAKYSKEVQLLIALVRAAERGDSEAYNACFSPEYIQESGRIDSFTMQKIYDIMITEYRTSIGVPEGYRTAAVYGLRYKIKDNNGSLRNDMGSDAEHEQYISVVTDAQGNAWIYGIQLYYSR